MSYLQIYSRTFISTKLHTAKQTYKWSCQYCSTFSQPEGGSKKLLLWEFFRVYLHYSTKPFFFNLNDWIDKTNLIFSTFLAGIQIIFQRIKYTKSHSRPRTFLSPAPITRCDWLLLPPAAIALRSCHSCARPPHCCAFRKWKWRRRKTEKKKKKRRRRKKIITDTRWRRGAPWDDGRGSETWEVKHYFGVCVCVGVGGDGRQACAV